MDNLLVPPHSLEAEQSVIGSILQDNTVFDDLEITEKEFYSRSHRITFSAISKLIETGEPVDLLTLTNKLELQNLIDDAGGFVYIAQCIKSTPSSYNAKNYAKIVRENYIKREILSATMQIQEQIHETDSDSKESCSFAEEKICSISEVFTEKSTNKSMHEIAVSFVDQLESRAESGSDLLGVSTGLTDLDAKTSGLEKSDLIILAARPSMGKTTLAMNIVEEEALSGGFPLVFSLEMPSEQLFMRLVSAVGVVNIGNIRKANLNDEEWGRISSATQRINNSNLEINDNSSMTVQDIRLACREYKKKKGDLTLVMIDYLQLISGKNKENRTQEISEISRGLKALAKEFKCPVLALSQLNRGLENRSNKRPINADLRESGQIEQDADVIMFIYRDEVYNEQSQDKGLAEIIIGKARNGEIGMVGTVFDGARSRFRNLSGQTIIGEVEEKTSMFT